jgi:hypothetical protein
MTISTPRQLMSGCCCRRSNSAMASGVGPRLDLANGGLAVGVASLAGAATVVASADAFASFFLAGMKNIM